MQPTQRPVFCGGPGCDRPVKARGLCDGHYDQRRKGRSLTPILRDSQRIWGRVQKTESCWIWIGQLKPSGYGTLRHGGRMQMAHRVVYELLSGPVPEGLSLDHLCRVRRCVNPSHLEPVTTRVNTMRGVGATAANAKKTHCPQGHPLDDGNLKPSQLARGYRSCLTCSREQAREQYRKSKARK